MLLRLENRDATYSSTQWAKERNRNLYYLRNISSFPQKYIAEAEKLNSNGVRPVSARGGGNGEPGDPEKRRDKLPLISQKRSDTFSSLDSRDEQETVYPEGEQTAAEKLEPGDGLPEESGEETTKKREHDVRKATSEDAREKTLQPNTQRRSSHESIRSLGKNSSSSSGAQSNKKVNRGNNGKRKGVTAKELDRRNRQATSGRHEKE